MITLEQSRAAVVLFADYESDPTGKRCEQYLTACRRFLILAKSEYAIGGSVGVSEKIDTDTIYQMISSAEQYLRTCTNDIEYGGVVQLNIGGVYNE